MLSHAIEAMECVEASSFEELERNRTVQHVLIRCIQIVGEAASKLSLEFRDTHSDIPWRPIIAMRHQLVHAYMNTDLRLVWHTANQELPPLIAWLEERIRDSGPSAGAV